MNNLIYYINKKDPLEEVRYCKEEEFDDNNMELIDLDDEELEKINKLYSTLKSDSDSIKAYYKDKYNKYTYISFSKFNPLTMKLEEDNKVDEKYLKDVKKFQEEREKYKREVLQYDLSKYTIDNTKTYNEKEHPSPFYNGKIDEGAINDLLDKGLSGAKDRADERTKKNGGAFNKHNAVNKLYRRKD